MVMMIRSIESYGMYTLGDKYFFKNDRGLGMYHRLKALCWAAFALLPMLDLIVPEDWSNPQNSKHKLHDLKFRFPLYWWTVMELYTTVRCIGAISNPKNSFSKVEIASALAMLSFFNGGIGINTSHELLHKNSIFEKVLGYALLMNVNYIHWGEEHLTGHHRNVATPGDPATSRLNETFYQFFPRTLYGSWKSALSIELNRLNMNSQSAWSPIHNRIMWCAMVPMMWAGFILKVTGGGLKAVQYFYIQGFGSATLLELVNYIEHYGLAREKLANGDFEPVNPTHSWNAPHRLSNSLLYKLQRHSDHHTFASRPYQLLRNFEESPQLPNGYPSMILMALFPPVFFAVMNPLVASSKVKPVHYKNGGTFEKDKEWLQAEKDAKRKTILFSLVTLLIGTKILLSNN